MTAVRDSLGRGAAFLLNGQDADGGWRDFDLRPGVSTSWTTAYVAARVADLADIVPAAATAAAAGERFLWSNRKAGGGWAYNARCPADADSTALALLFLGRRAPPRGLKDAAVLAAFQHPDGGFATYRPWRADHGWARPHAEVTATALRALALFLPSDHWVRRCGLAWLVGRAAQPAPATYWWATGAYLKLELARLGLAVAGEAAADADNAGAFASALDLERAVLSGAGPGAIESATQNLIARQCADGGWPSEPILRLPDPAAAPEAADARADSLHADQNRLFTTATALSALKAARRSAVTDPP